ncbi:MAG: hypothetical protein AAF718_05665 [Pseudomonadota bacterium]
MTVARLWTWVVLVVSAIVFATIVRAETSRQDVLTCFEGIDAETEWNQCLNIMFSPCADQDVGSEGHLVCLTEERANWRAAKLDVEKDVIARLTEDGMAELSGLMLAWPEYVEDKCNAVGEARANISREAADLGCQISEYALLTNEMEACLTGRSTEAYCQLRDE